jgi:hypothetical protein
MEDRIYIRFERNGTEYEGYLFPRGGLLYGGIVLPQSFRNVLNGKYQGDLDFEEGEWSGIDPGLMEVIVDYLLLWYE